MLGNLVPKIRILLVKIQFHNYLSKVRLSKKKNVEYK
jgi:hypothetical protein